VRLRRYVQTFSFVFFLSLIGLAAWSTITASPLDLFLRLDPGAALTTVIADRGVTHELIPALIVVVLTLVLGRFFCGWVCPMGTLINLTDTVIRTARRRNRPSPTWRWVKYGVLAFLIAAALLGISFAFLAVPIPLITRLAALVVQPVIALAADGALYQPA